MPASDRRSCVGIIGLGLMGGSLARELAARGGRVLGHDTDRSAMLEAEKAGVLGTLPDSLEGLEAAELVVVAVPVNRAEAVLRAALPRIDERCVITDLGSTKRSVQEAAVRLGVADRFVGSHPLTGGHRSGWGASHRDLYAWSRVFLCPTPATLPGAIERVRRLWEGVGALPEVLDAAEHDRLVAWTSHLPQLAATALALALEAAGEARRELGPGGRDTTRLAASSPEMWGAICIDNADFVTGALDELRDRLDAIRAAIVAGDRAAVEQLFTVARGWAEREPAPG